MKTKITLIAAALLLIANCLLPTNSFAQDGSLDLSFGTGGKVTTDFQSLYEFDECGKSIVIQSDGKIVVAGYCNNITNNCYDFGLSRYNSNGSLDNTFSSDGKVLTNFGSGNDYGQSVAIQSDGKIVVAGTSYNLSCPNNNNPNFALVRYNSNGTLDNTFGSGGKVTTDIGSDDYGSSIAIQSDGKIVVAGSCDDIGLIRYNSDGSLDNTFSSDGIVTIVTTTVGYSGSSVAIQNDGKILVGGGYVLVRYNNDGSLDNTFGSGGIVTTTGRYGSSIAIQNDGKIVVAGNSYNGTNYDFSIIRYNSNGTLDNTFSSDGIVTTAVGDADDNGYAVAIQSNGKIVVAGTSFIITDNNDFALVRYNSDGSLDNTFASVGTVTTDFGSSTIDEGKSIAIQSDGKIVVAGCSKNGTNYDFAIARYHGGTVGIEENTEMGNLNIYPNPTTGKFSIEYPNKYREMTLDVYNVLGEKIYYSKFKHQTLTDIDLSDSPKGIYFAKVYAGTEIYNQKIVVQ